MPEAQYRFTTANKAISIPQGVTFYQRWQIRYQATGLPFPLFSEAGVALWRARCMIRAAYTDAAPLVSLTTENGGVVLTREVAVDGSVSVFYGIYLTATQTAALPATNLPTSATEKPVYDIELERLSDNWIIRPQKGRVTIEAEATK